MEAGPCKVLSMPRSCTKQSNVLIYGRDTLYSTTGIFYYVCKGLEHLTL
jgi:hypothetical protein